MPPWLAEALKVLGFTTPFIYAGATYGLFRWLDKKASGPARIAISNWLQPKHYNNEAIGAAVIEMFNRLYTPKLASKNAFARSALFTICMTIIFWYEFYSHNTVNALNIALLGTDVVVRFVLLGGVFTNIISDYVSLFVVKKLLIVGKDKPVLALSVGPAIGMGVVALFSLVRDVVITIYTLERGGALGFWNDLYQNLMTNFIEPIWLALLLAALIVHLWLPLFFVCVVVLRGINYLRAAVHWTQWFIKQGRTHPFEAIGYIAAIIVFVGTIVAQKLGISFDYPH